MSLSSSPSLSQNPQSSSLTPVLQEDGVAAGGVDVGKLVSEDQGTDLGAAGEASRGRGGEANVTVDLLTMGGGGGG